MFFTMKLKKRDEENKTTLGYCIGLSNRKRNVGLRREKLRGKKSEEREKKEKQREKC